MLRLDRKTLGAIALLLMLPVLGGANPFDAGKIKKANKLFAEGKLSQAQERYVTMQANRPDAPELYYNLGNVKYKLKEYPQAEEMFKKVLLGPPSPMQQKGFYNLGNVKVRQGQLEEALGMYKKAMELDASDKEAKFNYEWVLDKIKKMQQQNKEQKEQDKKDKKDDKDKKDQKDQQKQDQKQDKSGKQDKKKQDQKSGGQGQEKEKDKQEQQKKESPSQQGEKEKGEQGQEQQRQQGSQVPTATSNTQENLADKKELSKEEAKALLMWMDEEERRARAHQTPVTNREADVEKDW